MFQHTHQIFFWIQLTTDDGTKLKIDIKHHEQDHQLFCFINIHIDTTIAPQSYIFNITTSPILNNSSTK